MQELDTVLVHGSALDPQFNEPNKELSSLLLGIRV